MPVYYSKKYKLIFTFIHKLFNTKPRPKDEAFLTFLTSSLGLSPGSIELYQLAFTHSSYKNIDPSSSDYERLEHIGDCVVDLVVADYLYKKHPTVKVGKLSQLKSEYVSRGTLYRLTLQIFDPKYYRFGPNVAPSDKVCSDFYESLVGAIYLDKGLDQARQFVHNSLIRLYDEGRIKVDILSYKALFVRWSQKYKQVYSVAFNEQKQGRFLCELKCKSERTIGVDTSKKKAEEIAMRLMCRRLKIAK